MILARQYIVFRTFKQNKSLLSAFYGGNNGHHIHHGNITRNPVLYSTTCACNSLDFNAKCRRSAWNSNISQVNHHYQVFHPPNATVTFADVHSRHTASSLPCQSHSLASISFLPASTISSRSLHHHIHIFRGTPRNISSSPKYFKISHHPLLNKRDGVQANHLSVSRFSTTRLILESSPQILQPYLRLIRFDKPIGSWLLYWPCTWSIALAAQPGWMPDARLLALFGAGAFFMRGAGCIINDMWDQDFDSKVERTKTRPLASGEITQFQALVFLGTQLSCALAILLQLNMYSVLLGAASMGLVILYPLAKRFTYWPQLMLGLTLNWGVLLAWSSLRGSVELPGLILYAACTVYTLIYDTIYSHQVHAVSANMAVWALGGRSGFTFNYGALLGWAAVKGSVAWNLCLPLYVSCVIWTIIYDTIYAHQDKYDDMLIGVKSTAVCWGDQTKPYLSVFAAIMTGGLATSGYLADMTWPYYMAVGITSARVAQQIYSVNLNDADDCARSFRGNFYLGAIMFIGIVMANYIKSQQLAATEETAWKDESVEKEMAEAGTSGTEQSVL